MIEITNLNFTYHSRPNPALNEINLKIMEGDFILLTGSSGSGKSTLVRCLNGLIPHFHGGTISGEIRVNDKNPLDLSPKQMATDVGFVFQNTDNQLFMNTVESEIVFGLENLAVSPEDMETRINESLSACRIDHLRYRTLSQLSGGERQKVAIASVLAMYPRYIILDEPTAELDGESADAILNLLVRLNRDRHLTIILIEHRLERILPLCSRVIIMDGGHIVRDGPPKEVMGEDLSDLHLRLPPILQLSTHLQLRAVPLSLSQMVAEFTQFLDTIPLKTFENFSWPKEKPPQPHSAGDSPPQPPPQLEIDGVNFAYEGKNDVLRDITLRFDAGEMVGIIGRNGSGKSTLLKTFNALLRPRKGTVTLNGHNIAKASISDLAKEIGYIFQNPALQFYQDTVEEEILYYYKNLQKYRKGKSSEARPSAKLENILTSFRLQTFRKHYPRYLSVGEQQKVALASVYITRPSILLLDEPTHGMDNTHKREFFEILRRYASDGHIVIVISHDVETLAEYSTRIVYLKEGTVAADGTPGDILPKTDIFNTQINRLFNNFPRLPQTILTTQEAVELLSDE